MSFPSIPSIPSVVPRSLVTFFGIVLFPFLSPFLSPFLVTFVASLFASPGPLARFSFSLDCCSIPLLPLFLFPPPPPPAPSLRVSLLLYHFFSVLLASDFPVPSYHPASLLPIMSFCPTLSFSLSFPLSFLSPLSPAEIPFL